MNRELGDLRNTGMCLTFLGVCAVERGDTALATMLYEEDMRMLQGLRDVTGVVFGLSGMACVAALKSEPIHTARLWGAAEALRESVNQPLSPFDQNHPNYERLVSTAREMLGDEKAWEVALVEGRAMTPEQALEYAIEGEKALPAPVPAPTETRGEDVAKEYLTGREREVAILASREMTNREIASELVISERTVATHMHRILRKLGLQSRTQLAAWVREQQ